MTPQEFQILIIDEVHQVLLDQLQDYSVNYMPEISPEEVKQKINQYDAIIMRSKLNLDHTYLNHTNRLKIIGRLGSGMDNIDEAIAEKKGIYLLNAPEGNRDAVAEQTVGMLLALLNNVKQSQQELEQGIWDRKNNSGVELNSLTVGIIGYGNVGAALAQKLEGFGCKVLAYDLYRSNFGSDKVEEVPLQKIYMEADVVSLHVPLNDSSKYLVNDEFIDNMHKPFYLLNLARGKVVNTPAVIRGLESGKLLGAALDVLENEKLNTFNAEEKEQFSYLLKHPKVIITPHIGGLTHNSFIKLSKVLAEKVKEKINIILSLTENSL